MVDIYQRQCVKDWHIEARNGDRLDLYAGKTYTTSAPRADGRVMVFSKFWVPVPVSIFSPMPCPTCGRSA